MQENSFEHTQEQALKPTSLGWRDAWKVTREVYIWIIGINIFLGLFQIVFGGSGWLLLLLSTVLPIAGIVMGIKRALPQAQSGFPIFRTALLIGAIPLAILFLIEVLFIVSSVDALRVNGLFAAIVVVGQISKVAFSLFLSSLVYSITAAIILFKRRVTGDISLRSFFSRFVGLIFLLTFLYIAINGISAAALLVLSNTTSESQENTLKETSKDEAIEGNIYRSSNAAFSIQTPPNFEQFDFVSSLGQFREYTKNEEDGVIQDEEGRWIRAGIYINIVSVGGKYAEKLEEESKDFWNAAPGDSIEGGDRIFKKVKNINLDGCSAVWISSVTASIREDSVACIYDSKDSISLTLVAEEEVFSEYIEDYETMLATFRFKEVEDKTSRWQTYAYLNMSLKYPHGYEVIFNRIPNLPDGFSISIRSKDDYDGGFQPDGLSLSTYNNRSETSDDYILSTDRVFPDRERGDGYIRFVVSETTMYAGCGFYSRGSSTLDICNKIVQSIKIIE